MKAETIAVGMSGGVDSSVTALLLREAGYNVVGITLLLRPRIKGETEESFLKEARDAAAVCRELNIPHHIADFTANFKREVLDYFAGEYFAGRTPNPCIRCNNKIKFGLMLNYAIGLGCSRIATGHWAGIEQAGERYLLKKADSTKDQSYFLYSLSQYQLAHTMFPLFFKEKQEARDMAKRYGLPVAQKPDSQDICFVRDGDYIGFLEDYKGVQGAKGSFVDSSGNCLGAHGGIHRYTVGQRRGLGIALGERRFVTAIDPGLNTVTLGSQEDCRKSSLVAHSCNFIPFDAALHPIRAQAKPRYRAKAVDASVIPLPNKTVRVDFDTEQSFVSPGQAVVFYDGDLVLGGGIIQGNA